MGYKALGLLVAGLLLTPAFTYAQQACTPDNPMYTIYECVNDCQANCEKEEKTQGFFTSELSAEDKIDDQCDCESLGLSAYKKCIKFRINHFKVVWKHLGMMGLTDGGEAWALRQWGAQKIKACKALLQ